MTNESMANESAESELPGVAADVNQIRTRVSIAHFHHLHKPNSAHPVPRNEGLRPSRHHQGLGDMVRAQANRAVVVAIAPARIATVNNKNWHRSNCFYFLAISAPVEDITPNTDSVISQGEA